MPKKSYSRKRARKKRTSFRKNKRKQKTRKSKRRTMRKQVGSGYYKCPGDFGGGCPLAAYHFTGRGNTGWWAGENINWRPAAGYWSGQRVAGEQMKGKIDDDDNLLCPECFKEHEAAVAKLLELTQQNDLAEARNAELATKVHTVQAATRFSDRVSADMSKKS